MRGFLVRSREQEGSYGVEDEAAVVWRGGWGGSVKGRVFLVRSGEQEGSCSVEDGAVVARREGVMEVVLREGVF